MKHQLIAMLTLCVGSLVSSAASAVPIMMMTEYVENINWRNNAIEITNIGDTAGSLAGLTLDIYRNGSNSITRQVTLDAVSLAPGETWVVTTASPTDAALVLVADQFSNELRFNGDDAIVLANAGLTLDSIGQVGTDPGQAWGTAPESTRNATLRRDPSLGPDLLPGDLFVPALSWTGSPVGDISGLGAPPPGVPEPSTAALLLSGLLLCGVAARR